ncbi:TolB family protein [Limnospira fusiformis]|uniref:TolB family protein n=1 Tax=Limnospira fusiformis TaxID=54297 RepID=UPI0034E09F6D
MINPYYQRLFIIGLLVICLGMVSGCGGYPRLLNLPPDKSGNSVNSPSSEMNPQISSDYLVFASDRQGRQDIYLYDRQQAEFIDLPGLNSIDAIASEPAISSDGNYIVFNSTRGGQSDIYLYNRNTRQLRNLTDSLNAQVRHPTINADASVIAFESSLNGQWDIVVYNRYGQALNIP